MGIYVRMCVCMYVCFFYRPFTTFFAISLLFLPFHKSLGLLIGSSFQFSRYTFPLSLLNTSVAVSTIYIYIAPQILSLAQIFFLRTRLVFSTTCWISPPIIQKESTLTNPKSIREFSIFFSLPIHLFLFLLLNFFLNLFLHVSAINSQQALMLPSRLVLPMEIYKPVCNLKVVFLKIYFY